MNIVYHDKSIRSVSAVEEDKLDEQDEADEADEQGEPDKWDEPDAMHDAILYLLQGKPHHSYLRHAWQLGAPEPPSQVGPSVRSFGSRKSVVNATGSALAGEECVVSFPALDLLKDAWGANISTCMSGP